MHSRMTFCACLFLVSLHSHAEGIEVVTEDSMYAYHRDGKIVGPGTRIVEETLRGAALTDYSLTIYPWARAYEKALHEPDVLIYPVTRTAIREELFEWVGEIHRVTIKFYKLRGRTGITVNSLEDAKRYTVGVVRNDTKQTFLELQGFTRLVVSADNRDNFQKLLNQQIQLLPMSEPSARLASEAAQLDFDSLEEIYSISEQPARIYMAFSRGTSDEVVDKARRSFEQLEASGAVARIWSEDRPSKLTD
ncbi:substrate-binding periplasmic protein [Pseudomonas sp. DSP3-2-2]|uniref:substrate-binding periplasmic protein n=1 Tax=unclassified Pseudomonas TaxID=196821 RepID=UPI003CF93180